MLDAALGADTALPAGAYRLVRGTDRVILLKCHKGSK